MSPHAYLTNLRLRAVVESDRQADLVIPVPENGDVASATVGRTRMRFAGAWHEVPVLDRWKISRTAVVAGPARIDQIDTTIVVPPGWSGSVDAMGNIELTHGSARDA